MKQRDKSKKENRNEDIEAPIMKEKWNPDLNELGEGELDYIFPRVLKKLILKLYVKYQVFLVCLSSQVVPQEYFR